MEKIAIITDSCADILPEYLERYHIFVLPMQITCLDGTYRDGVDIHAEDIYEKLKTELPKSSTPSGADVEDTFEEIKKQGYTKAIAVLLSGGLSGTVNQVRLIAEEAEDLEITVYDSRQASIGIGVIAIQAAQYVAAGISYEALKEKMERLISGTKVFFSIDTLEYLQKGGRIGKAAALAGTLLDIKPILSFDKDGEIYTAAKVRSHKAVEKKLIHLMEEQKEDRPFNLVVADGGAPEEREELEERLKELFPGFQAIYRAKIGAALSIYLGDRLLGAGIQYLD